MDALWIQVDDKPVRMHSGAPDWSTGYVTFDSAGEHTVGIGFNRYRSTIGAVNAEACIAAVRVLSAEELAALKASEPVYPKVLEGTALRIETIDGELKQARVHTADNKIEQPIDVLRSNSFTHRICVGKDVDPSTVLIVYDGRYHLLSNLPCDTEGFLMRYDSTDPLNKELPPYHSLTLYANAFAPAESSKETVVWVGSENEMDSFVGFLTQFCQQVQHIDVELDWEYADGTPKQGAESIIAPSDGTGKYSFTVQDESGAPVAGVMLQICDDGTCAVAVTDANGAATHEAPAYPYEIHVLRVPEGYAAHAETYTMPAEGGSLVITLQKQ